MAEAWIRSDLRLPQGLHAVLSVYLLFAIGLRGGAELGHATVLAPVAGALLLALVTPLTAFAVLCALGRFDVVNAAAVAAHYGSVSAVTFTASLAFLAAVGVAHEPFLPALVAVMEVPGIVVALMLAWTGQPSGGAARALRGILTGKSVLLLAGGLAIGAICGRAGMAPVEPFFVTPFNGVLTLFLLEMGLVAGDRLRGLGRRGAFLVGFGVVVPIAHGALGVLVGCLTGLSLGGATVLGAITASASHIAAPAAVRVALPGADPGLYLTASIAVTFPFNLTVGIPLYHHMAKKVIEWTS